MFTDAGDDVDGNVREEDAKKRRQCGWYGRQEPGRLRMDPDITSQALQEKAKCPDGALQSHGLYKFTHLPTGETYIGKAERQSLEKRIKQHTNKATSHRKLTGDVDPLLRSDPQESNWGLAVYPMEKDEVAEAEAIVIKKLQPSLNKQQPQGRRFN